MMMVEWMGKSKWLGFEDEEEDEVVEDGWMFIKFCILLIYRIHILVII